MIIKALQTERYQDYKLPAMLIACNRCSFKCDHECGKRVCQNSTLAKAPDIAVDITDIADKYMNNPITKAIIFGGLEPFDQFGDIVELITLLRIKYRCDDMVVIYTGYNKDELRAYLKTLRKFKNITVKFGRYVPNQKKHYDAVLGVELASDNQYAEVIS